MIRLVQQALYPSFCFSCGQLIANGQTFCPPCLGIVKMLPSVVFPITASCDLKVFAAAAYQDPVRGLVTKKFYGDLVGSYQLADLMLQLTPIQKASIDYITYVPLHWQRYAWRGFNQSHEMAKALGKALKIPVVGIVRRQRKTQFQWKLKSNDRKENIQGAFAPSWHCMLRGGSFIRGKHIALVDDLCTTGTTLVHVAKIIAQFKPASITAFVGCRAT